MFHKDRVGIAIGHQSFLVLLREFHLHPSDFGEDGPRTLGLEASAVDLQMHAFSEDFAVLADEAADVEEGKRTAQKIMVAIADVAVYLLG